MRTLRLKYSLVKLIRPTLLERVLLCAKKHDLALLSAEKDSRYSSASQLAVLFDLYDTERMLAPNRITVRFEVLKSLDPFDEANSWAEVFWASHPDVRIRRPCLVVRLTRGSQEFRSYRETYGDSEIWYQNYTHPAYSSKTPGQQDSVP